VFMDSVAILKDALHRNLDRSHQVIRAHIVIMNGRNLRVPAAFDFRANAPRGFCTSRRNPRTDYGTFRDGTLCTLTTSQKKCCTRPRNLDIIIGSGFSGGPQ
jgi:hypothetical protein